MDAPLKDPECQRLIDDSMRTANWKRWGPYLSERQWGTVREDYSADGSCWDYFTHDQARSRAYRWGEDGLLGMSDRECRLCFGLALWNEKDPILKERLFGLTGPQGNHGEDVKELYYYLDSTPTHSYMKALYKYPQALFPYDELVRVNSQRSRAEPEYELLDTGIFAERRYFDVFAEYAKADPDDTLIRITIANRGPDSAIIHLLPQLWLRNSWSWGRVLENCETYPSLTLLNDRQIQSKQATLPDMYFAAEPADGIEPELLFTENNNNNERLFNTRNETPFVKDAFHRHVIEKYANAVNPANTGTKAAAHYRFEIPAGGEVVVRLRLTSNHIATTKLFDASFDRVFFDRIKEADQFYSSRIPKSLTPEETNVARQAYAGLLWSKQFYHYIVRDWLEGDPSQPTPPASRRTGRNADWTHLYNRDVISMPDNWEYPWFAAWDLAFHMIPFAHIDATFAKEQLLLILREWYTHPNGQIPAYEFSFSDANPPVHAWACWRVYKMTGKKGERDIQFLERAFQKLLINFTWWVNRKDINGKHIFAGGFLGLDNIGVFDRSKPLPTGGHLEQADGTAWMASYCSTMLSIALELAEHDISYEDIASKFFEHFIAIVDAMNTVGGTGLWNEQDGFYYDMLTTEEWSSPMRIRSLVGMVPLFACELLETDTISKLPGFSRRLQWFLKNRKDLAKNISYMECKGSHSHYLLAVPSRDKLEKMLRYLVDESEFLSDFGIRSLSRVHEDHPFVFEAGGQQFRVQYTPGESTTPLFGGNSNWRGPIWFPMNYLIIESLERYHHFYQDDLKIECPARSGKFLNLCDLAIELRKRLAKIFMPNQNGYRPCHAQGGIYAVDPHFKNLVLFNEYFHGDTGAGLGASHQTGWTGLIARCLEELAPKTSRDQQIVSPPDAIPLSHAP